MCESCERTRVSSVNATDCCYLLPSLRSCLPAELLLRARLLAHGRLGFEGVLSQLLVGRLPIGEGADVDRPSPLAPRPSRSRPGSSGSGWFRFVRDKLITARTHAALPNKCVAVSV